MKKLHTVSKKTKNKKQKTSCEADCGSDHRLHIAKFRLQLKKVGKTTRPARYDLNQIPSEYTAEVMNRFKGLHLVNSVPDERWMEVCNIVLEAVNKSSQRKRNARRQRGFLRRLYK